MRIIDFCIVIQIEDDKKDLTVDVEMNEWLLTSWNILNNEAANICGSIRLKIGLQ